MATVRAARAPIAFPAEVVARRRTCAVDDAGTVVVAVVAVDGAAAVRSVATLVGHLLKTDKLKYMAGLSNRQPASV